MPKARPKRRPTRTHVRSSTPKRANRRKPSEEEAFTKSLIAHGQAVKLPPGGTLPPGATHELVENDKGEVRAVRRRFSIL